MALVQRQTSRASRPAYRRSKSITPPGWRSVSAGLAARQTKASRGAPIDARNVRVTACPGPRPLARVPSGVGLLSFELTLSSAISSSPDAEFNAQVRVIAAN